MKLVARFMTSRTFVRSGTAGVWPVAERPSAKMAAETKRLRARLNIRDLREEAPFVASRIVDDARRAIEHHRSAARECIDRPRLERFRLRIARPREREPRVAHHSGQRQRVNAGSDL